jgi:hypothetical protein
MKYLIYFFLIYAKLLFSQISPCDKKILNKIEFEKCVNDSIWHEDLKIKIEYISKLKTSILPKYRIKRKNLILSNEISNSIIKLKSLYDSTYIHKSKQFKIDFEKNSYYLQPKSYLSTVLSLELFQFYPDLYAILLNPIHINLTPKTDQSKITETELIVKEIINLLPETTLEELKKNVSDLKSDKIKIIQNHQIELFQGGDDLKDKLNYDIVNFLIWNE